jgi:CRISPR/Cas system-associated protein Csm6
MSTNGKAAALENELKKAESIKSSSSDLSKISSEFSTLEDQLQKLLAAKSFSGDAELNCNPFDNHESAKVLELEEHLKLLDLENAFLARRINKLTSEKRPK